MIILRLFLIRLLVRVLTSLPDLNSSFLHLFPPLPVPSGVSNDVGKDQGARETNEKQGT